MSNINSIVISGHCGEYKKLKQLDSGLSILEFSFANNRYRGNKEDKTTWWKAVLFGKRAEKIEEYINKGTYVVIQGTMDKDKYKNKDDSWERHTKIIVNELEFRNNKSTAEKEKKQYKEEKNKKYNDNPFNN